MLDLCEHCVWPNPSFTLSLCKPGLVESKNGTLKQQIRLQVTRVGQGDYSAISGFNTGE